ncbi:hypothetical protein PHJA_001897800 [Phtheirospermum japonicum]|uniref:Uncharacterized protein n=1 Tax=Phtheirospermum japonicum TaxID=374723 RepID=A0A830C9W2_9LAMI|nr:hypothetical protein PHJA_001897800 [Phtheirospermum japonicum]
MAREHYESSVRDGKLVLPLICKCACHTTELRPKVPPKTGVQEGLELDVDFRKKRSSDYAVAKEIGINEASQVIGVHDIEHIIVGENKRLIGEVVEKTATDWNFQKELSYQRSGIGRLPVASFQGIDVNAQFYWWRFIVNKRHLLRF